MTYVIYLRLPRPISLICISSPSLFMGKLCREMKLIYIIRGLWMPLSPPSKPFHHFYLPSLHTLFIFTSLHSTLLATTDTLRLHHQNPSPFIQLHKDQLFFFFFFLVFLFLFLFLFFLFSFFFFFIFFAVVAIVSAFSVFFLFYHLTLFHTTLL